MVDGEAIEDEAMIENYRKIEKLSFEGLEGEEDESESSGNEEIVKES
jgi:hypothetical protein